MPAATLELRRERGRYADRLRAYRVMIDGEDVGTVRRDETQVYEIEPGRHSVQLHIDWCCSRPLAVDAHPGGRVRLTCKPNAHALTGLYWITFGRGNYIALAPSESSDAGA